MKTENYEIFVTYRSPGTYEKMLKVTSNENKNKTYNGEIENKVQFIHYTKDSAVDRQLMLLG